MTVRLLKVASYAVANFYGDRGAQYMSLPGMKPGDKIFGIICKDSWEEDGEGALSEGSILQLLHAKEVQGVSWCSNEKPVLAPDPPPLLYLWFTNLNSSTIPSRKMKTGSKELAKGKGKEQDLPSLSSMASISHTLQIVHVHDDEKGHKTNMHKQACSVSANSGRGSYSILHRDMSPWNFMMVPQTCSDFPVKREWVSQEL
ncbi:hypothetical protein BDR07DRAFT_1381551 [Suillus spraguei]|nr:hypothetical protein BDR07DRAFT_1381551 [Suillus spraguei]